MACYDDVRLVMGATRASHSGGNEAALGASETSKRNRAPCHREKLFAWARWAVRIVERKKIRRPAAATRDFLRRKRRHAAGFLHAANTEQLGKKSRDVRG